jgi:hemolysin activation/secretion protein
MSVAPPLEQNPLFCCRLASPPPRLPRNQTPCFKIDRVVLSGDQAEDVQSILSMIRCKDVASVPAALT